MGTVFALAVSVVKCQKRNRLPPVFKCTVILWTIRGRGRKKQPSRGTTYLQTDKQMAGKWIDRTTRQRVRDRERQMASLQSDRRVDKATNGTQSVRQIWKLEDRETSPANTLSVHLEKAKMKNWQD